VGRKFDSLFRLDNRHGVKIHVISAVKHSLVLCLTQILDALSGFKKLTHFLPMRHYNASATEALIEVKPCILSMVGVMLKLAAMVSLLMKSILNDDLR